VNLPNKIAAVILAAGESSRLGAPKQLVKIGKQTLIENVIRIAQNNQLGPIIVVLGAYQKEIASVIRYLKVRTVSNVNWMNGLSSSIIIGIKALPKAIDAAMLFVVDQPFVSDEVVTTLIKNFHKSEKYICAPLVNGIQCPPVLYKKDVFKELLELKGDQGGKEVIKRNLVEWVEIQDKRLLIDIDEAADLFFINQASSSCP